MRRDFSTSDLLSYFQQEKAYLSQEGKAFAEAYPDMADGLLSRLSDPNVRLLLDSFAFLTGSLQREIEDAYPELASGLLSILYPQFVHPIPSMTVLQFLPDTRSGKMTVPLSIPKGSQLQKEGLAPDQYTAECFFKTGYDLIVCPLDILKAEFRLTSSFLSLSDEANNEPYSLALTCRAELPFTELTFYINGEDVTQKNLYDGIFRQPTPQASIFQGGQCLGIVNLEPLGLDTSLLPHPDKVHPSYTTLLEYFAFPLKYMFFKIENFSRISLDLKSPFDIVLRVTGSQHLSHMSIGPENFLPNCTPGINLFSKISEPLQLDNTQTLYPLEPDLRAHLSTEIYSIEQVFLIDPQTMENHTIPPFYGFDPPSSFSTKNPTSSTPYWISYRRSSFNDRTQFPGTEVSLGFVNPDLDPTLPNVQTVFAKLLCTNRDLPTQILPGTLLDATDGLPGVQVKCLTSPTPPVAPPLGGATLWNLVSQLAISRVSLTGHRHPLGVLKSTLELYSQFSTLPSPEIQAISHISLSSGVRRLGPLEWRTFGRGVLIQLNFSSQLLSARSPFLLASVLNQFLGLLVSTNSFTALTVTVDELPYYQWAPFTGQTSLL